MVESKFGLDSEQMLASHARMRLTVVTFSLMFGFALFRYVKLGIPNIVYPLDVSERAGRKLQDMPSNYTRHAGPLGQFSAKFYVYEDLDWLSMTCNGFRLDELTTGTHLPRKHFLQHAMEHRLRTKDPADALLFVVPALMNTILSFMNPHWSKGQCCIGGMCNFDLIRYTDRMLADSTWFNRKHGKDHAMVCSHWICKSMHWTKCTENYCWMRGVFNRLADLKNIPLCNGLLFETNSYSQ